MNNKEFEKHMKDFEKEVKVANVKARAEMDAKWKKVQADAAAQVDAVFARVEAKVAAKK